MSSASSESDSFKFAQGLRRLAGSNTAPAILDQAFYSGATIGTSVLLGRWAGSEVLGVYALAYAVAVLVICGHESFVTLPYTIAVHRLDAPAQRQLTGSSLALTGVIAALATLAFAALGGAAVTWTSRTELGWAFLALSGAVPLMLLREMARKHAFAHLQFWQALWLDAGVGALQIGGVLALCRWTDASAASAFAAVGAACGVMGLAWLAANVGEAQVRPAQVRHDLGTSWRAGRWIGAAVIALVFQNAALLWLVGWTLGKSAAGTFAAYLMLLNLSNPLVMAISSVFTPHAARALHAGGTDDLRRMVRAQAKVLSLIAGGFALVLMVWGDDLIELIYGAPYAGHATLISCLGVVALAKALETLPYNGLLVLHRAAASFWLNAAALATLALVTPVAVARWHLTGAGGALLLVSVSVAAARWAVFAAVLRTGPQPVEPSRMESLRSESRRSESSPPDRLLSEPVAV